jgi:hypothetical protein
LASGSKRYNYRTCKSSQPSFVTHTANWGWLRFLAMAHQSKPIPEDYPNRPQLASAASLASGLLTASGAAL